MLLVPTPAPTQREKCHEKGSHHHSGCRDLEAPCRARRLHARGCLRRRRSVSSERANRTSRPLRAAGQGHGVRDGRSEPFERRRHLCHSPEPKQMPRPLRSRVAKFAPLVRRCDPDCVGLQEQTGLPRSPREGAAAWAEVNGRLLPLRFTRRRADVRQQAFGARLLLEQEQQEPAALLKDAGRVPPSKTREPVVWASVLSPE